MNRAKISLVIFTAVGLVIFLFLYRNKVNSIKVNGLETIAKIIGSDGGHATSGPSVLYTYIVENKKFKGSAYLKNKSAITHKFYYVTYSSENHGWSEINLNRPAMDTVEIIAAGFNVSGK